MPVLERGEAGDVLVLDVVALGAELGDGGIQVAGVPQDDGVEDQAERGELILLALAVRLADLAPAAVADRTGQAVAGLPACYLLDTVSFTAALYGIARLPAMPSRAAPPGPGSARPPKESASSAAPP